MNSLTDNGRPAPWLTHHATRRLEEMELTPDEVYLTVTDPEVTFGHPREVRQRGRLAVVVHQPTGAVITVLWREVEEWSR